MSARERRLEEASRLMSEAAREAVKRVQADRELIRRGPRSPEEWGDLANARTLCDSDRETVIRRLSGHLLAKGLDPFLVLRLMEAFDTSSYPSLGLERVEELVAWVVERDARRLRGED